MKRIPALLCAVLWVATLASAQERPQAFTGAQIITVASPAITDGVLVVHRGKIIAVGARGSINIPADAEVKDVSGALSCPDSLTRTATLVAARAATLPTPFNLTCASLIRSTSATQA